MATSTTSKELGLNKPSPFTGDRTKITTFLQECKMYLAVNGDVYSSDDKKIVFVLSFMNDKEALRWKELYVDGIEDKATGNLIFPTYAQFLIDVNDAFRTYDRTQDAMNKLIALKQGNRTAEELITEFRLLAGQAGLDTTTASDHIHLIGLFRNALTPQLARRILFREVVPKTINDWCAKAIQFDTNYRMAMAITGRTTAKTTTRQGNYQGRSWFQKKEQDKKDPDAMDVDGMMTQEKRNALLRKGACFNCEDYGHLAKDCPEKRRGKGPQEQMKKKWAPKDIRAQIKSLTKAERQELINLMTGDDGEEDADF